MTDSKNWFLHGIRRMVGDDLPLETETCRFILISMLDVFMTFLLLYLSNRRMMTNVVIESNPVARFFIEHWGTNGLIWFKIAMVILVVLATQAVAISRPIVAQCTLNLGSCVVGSVVIYSVYLLVQNAL